MLTFIEKWFKYFLFLIGTCLVRGDFIAEVIDSKGGVQASSDQFSAWWGDASYETANTTMVLTWKDGHVGTYLTMTNKGY